MVRLSDNSKTTQINAILTEELPKLQQILLTSFQNYGIIYKWASALSVVSWFSQNRHTRMLCCTVSESHFVYPFGTEIHRKEGCLCLIPIIVRLW